MKDKTFSFYFFLYICFAILMILIPFLISLATIFAKIGITAIINLFAVLLTGLFFFSVWALLFYATNLVFYLKGQYPYKNDNLLINTFSNIIITIVLINISSYALFFIIIPTVNLLLNFKYFLNYLSLKAENQTM